MSQPSAAAKRLFARLAHTYHFDDPTAVFRIPGYALAILIEELPGLEAQATLLAAQAAMVPHMKKEDRVSTIRALRRLAEVVVPRRPMPVIEYNPEKAKNWFARLGAKVTGKN